MRAELTMLKYTEKSNQDQKVLDRRVATRREVKDMLLPNCSPVRHVTILKWVNIGQKEEEGKSKDLGQR